MRIKIMNIQDTDILNKIINIQSCIIQGKSLKSILHKNRQFYLDKSGTDIITICMNDQEKVHPEYVIEKHRIMVHLLEKYIFTQKPLAWETFVNNHYPSLISNGQYFKTDDFHEVFKGLLTKREALSFKEELNMKQAVLMAVHDFSGKEVIGVVCFLYSHETEPDISKLDQMRQLFQALLQPLYDQQYRFIYNKCVRVDENFSLLTEQEKRITKKVLAGHSYNEISKMLNISINTLKTHMKNIFMKYSVNSKIELFNKLNPHQ